MAWTKEQADTFLAGVQLRFKGYHKYSFTFVGEKYGFNIVGRISGNGDDIYGERIEPEMLATKMWVLTITDVKGEIVYEVRDDW